MKLTNILSESLTPSEQAHNMGLEYAGYARWKDPKTGKIVAKTMGDKLVKVEASAEKTQFSAGSSAQQAPVEKPEQEKIRDEFLASCTNQTDELQFHKNLITALKIPETITFAYMEGKPNGSVPPAYFDIQSKQIVFREDVLTKLTFLAQSKKGEIAEYVDRLLKGGPKKENDEFCAAAIQGFHFLTHESIHATDDYINITMDKKWGRTTLDHDVGIVEGLTEFYARRKTAEMVSGRTDLTHAEVDAVSRSDGYSDRVDEFRFLNKVSPNIVKKIWDELKYEDRVSLMNSVLDGFMADQIESVPAKDEQDKLLLMKAKGMLDIMSAGGGDWVSLMNKGYFTVDPNLALAHPDKQYGSPNTLYHMVKMYYNIWQGTQGATNDNDTK
jgi:hypothetical protein